MALREQISEWPVERRILAGGVLFALIIALIFTIYLMFFRIQYDVLFSDLRPADAAAIVAELDERAIPYKLGNEETSILVPADQLGETRVAIAGSDLPITGAVGFELFNESDMGLTEFAQKINYQRALQGELARTIMAMEEVESARVHLTIPERAIFRGEKSVPKAAVTIHTRIGRTLDRASVDGIQKLVASSVNDLQLSDVSILDDSGRVISQALGSEEYLAPELAEKQALEQYYRARISNALEDAAPGQNIKVEVRATGLARDAFERGASDDADPASEADRNFRLFVRLISPVTPTDEEQQRLRSLIENAMAYSEDIGDRIIFSNASDAVPGRADPVEPDASWTEEPVQPNNNATADLVGTPWMESWLPWLLGVIAILVLAAALIVRRRTKLTDVEHSDFASRLQSELASEGTA